MRVSIICVGNGFRGDDGFGPAVARYLRERYMFPAGVEVVDRIALGLTVVSDLMACEGAVVVGAVDGTGAEAGALLPLTVDDLAQAGLVPLHEERLIDIWERARFMGTACAGAQCFGVQVGTTVASDLTDPVAAAVAPCARAVVDHLARTWWLYATDLWQVTADPRARLADPAAYVRGELARRGHPEAEGAVVAQLPAGGLFDFEADELIRRVLDAQRAA